VTIDNLNLNASGGAGIDVASATNTSAFNLRLLDSELSERVVMNNTGSGAFGLLVDNNDITTTGSDVAFSLAFSGTTAQTGNVTIRNGNTFVADDASALAITTSGAALKTVNLLVSGSSFMNSSAASPTANITSGGNSLMNANVQTNTFTDLNAGGSDYTMTASGATGRIVLNLGGDTAPDFNTAAGVGTYNLINNTGGSFTLFEKTPTLANTRNTGTVNPVPNAAAFLDTSTPVPTPTVP
jgi:hypothetical protein